MSAGAQPWTPPPGPDARLDACGQGWDAVRVPDVIGICALNLLGECSGAVIEDTAAEVWYWLVLPGSASALVIPGAQVLGRGSYLVVPPPVERPGTRVRWHAPLEPTALLTDAGHLHDAVCLVHAAFLAEVSVRWRRGR